MAEKVKPQPGIKFLVSGFEASGKSTITSKIKDALIINFDGKIYNLPDTISSDFKDYQGVASLAEFINSKVKAYKEAFGKLPKYVVLDTITSLYTSMVNYNSAKYTGFNRFSQNEADTLQLNDYIEDVLIANGISVIIVAHAKWDEGKNCFVIPAQGQFKDRGSWQSYVNDSIFIDKTSNKRNVYLKSLKFIARSTIYGINDDQEEIMQPAKEYDINEHLAKLHSVQTQNSSKKL